MQLKCEVLSAECVVRVTIKLLSTHVAVSTQHFYSSFRVSTGFVRDALIV